MRCFFLFLILYSTLFAKYCFSQPEFSFSSLSLFSGDSTKFSIGTFGDAFLNSPSLNNHFFHEFNKSGHISEDIKNEVSGSLDTKNRLGADINYGLFYHQKLNSSWQYSISISDRAHANAIFPGDLFDLSFYGNKKFEGDTAILDNTNINYLRYQQIQAGIIKSSEKGNRYGLAASFLKGEENYYLKLDRARLFTEKNGESIEADFSAEINLTDTADKGIDAFHGWGISSDLFAEFPLKLKEYRSFFRAEVNDLGFIQWNNKSLSYKTDTSIHFEGAYISDIFQLNDSVLNAISPDTLSEDLRSSGITNNYSSYLPALMKLSWMLEADKFLFSFGVAHRLNANYSPFCYLKTTCKFSPYFSAGSKISYGGYGKICFGAEISFLFKNFIFQAGSNTLEGLIFSKYSGGNSGFIALRKEF